MLSRKKCNSCGTEFRYEIVFENGIDGHPMYCRKCHNERVQNKLTPATEHDWI